MSESEHPAKLRLQDAVHSICWKPGL
jgi:hypothetical protein